MQAQFSPGEIMRLLVLLVAAFSLSTAVHAQSLEIDQARPDNTGRPDSLYSVLEADGRFTVFLGLVERANLQGEFRNPQSAITVFAPTDAAFAELPPADRNALTGRPDRATAANLVNRHIMRRPMRRTDARGRRFFELRTRAGNNTYITINRDDTIYMDGGQMTETDISAGDSIIHVLANVLVE